MKVTPKGTLVPCRLTRAAMPTQGPLSKADYRLGTVNGRDALVGPHWFVPVHEGVLFETQTHWVDLRYALGGESTPFAFSSYLPSDKITLSVPSRAGRGER